jgi:hypothetical protein
MSDFERGKEFCALRNGQWFAATVANAATARVISSNRFRTGLPANDLRTLKKVNRCW